MREIMRIVASLLLGLLILSTPVRAQEDLAKQSQNPVGNMISLPFENNTYFGIGPSDSMSNALLTKPVYPVNLGKLNLINRLIVPIVWLEGQNASDNMGIATDDAFGLGDTTYQGFLSPAAPGKVIWGLGPAFVLPTHTDDALGVEKWSGGLSAVVLTMPGNWVLGFLAQNVWSFAGDEDAPDVNSFLFQYFLNYNLDEGWYLTSAPNITANWEADSDERWTVPLGGGGGRLVRFGKQPVDFKLAGY
ncbi:MAG: transporter [bacterium]|nr:transporter [bacterium]